MDEKYYNHCLKCGSIESVYKKKIINGHSTLSPTKFYFCSNPTCFFYINITYGIQYFSWVESSKFQWVKVFEYQKQIDNSLVAH